jgi:hypothetical protein
MGSFSSRRPWPPPNFQILSLDETEHAKLVEKAKIAAIVDRNSLKRSTEVADGFGAR